jgi:hypothetical protein
VQLLGHDQEVPHEPQINVHFRSHLQ